MIARLVGRLKQVASRSAFVRNFARIASANLISQAMLLLALPLLTRLFTPDEFGVAALFLSVFQLCVAFCTWSFDRMVPNTSSNTSAQILCLYAFVVLIFMCSGIFLVLLFEPEILNAWRGTSELGALLLLLPIAVFAMGLIKIANSWFARKTDLSILSKSIIAYAAAYLFIALVGGWLGLGKQALVYAIVGSYCAQFFTMLYLSNVQSHVRSMTLKRICAVGKNNIRDATTLSGVVSVNTLSLAAPVFLLAQVYSVAELGAYALVLRLVVTPLGVLTKSLSVSFWSRAAELAREKRYRELHALYKKVCLAMGVPVIIAIAFCLLGSRLLPRILGDDWNGAGLVLLAIIPYIIGFAVVSPTNHLWVLKRHVWQLIADGSRLGLMVLCILVASHFEWPFLWSVFALSVSSLIGHLILFMTHIVLHKKLF